MESIEFRSFFSVFCHSFHCLGRWLWEAEITYNKNISHFKGVFIKSCHCLVKHLFAVSSSSISILYKSFEFSPVNSQLFIRVRDATRLTLRTLFLFMMVMKKKLIIIAVLVISLVMSYMLCGTGQNDTGVDSIKIEEYTAILENRVGLDSVAGTYCGVLPPDVETTLTLNADGTYLLIRTFKEKQNEREQLRGTFQVLDGNILYKVRDANHIILIDSFGNEPKGMEARQCMLSKKNLK